MHEDTLNVMRTDLIKCGSCLPFLWFVIFLQSAEKKELVCDRQHKSLHVCIEGGGGGGEGDTN